MIQFYPRFRQASPDSPDVKARKTSSITEGRRPQTIEAHTEIRSTIFRVTRRRRRS